MWLAVSESALGVESLLKRGADVDGRGPNGETALMLAVKTAVEEKNEFHSEKVDEEKLKVIQTLVFGGASADIRDSQGHTRLAVQKFFNF
jgi:Ankyrin repeat